MSRSDDIKQLIINYNRRLQKLKEAQAMQGISVDPKIPLEIENIEVKIDELKVELTKLDDFKTSDIPNSGLPSLEEFLFLLDWLISEALFLYRLMGTHGEQRRRLALLPPLRKKALVYLAKMSHKLSEPHTERILHLLETTLPSYLGEANYVLPYPGERYSRSSEIWKKVDYEMDWEWRAIKDEFLKDNELKANFLELESDESRKWDLVGFTNAKEYKDYIEPDFYALCKSLTPVQKELLITARREKKMRQDDLIRRGFPKQVIIETFNCLLRSELMTTDFSELFELSELGEKLISDFLSQKSTA